VLAAAFILGTQENRFFAYLVQQRSQQNRKT
jgi:hypothetical protein